MKYFLFISALAEHFFYELVYMSIVASVIGIIIYLVTRIFKNKLSPKWVSRIWLFFIISLIIPIQIKSNFSIYNIFQEDLNVTFDNIGISQAAYINTRSKDDFQKNFEYSINQSLLNEEITESEVDTLTQEFNNDLEEATNPPIYRKILNILPAIWLCVLLTLVILYILIYITFTIKLKRTSSKNERLSKILEECKSEMKIKKKIIIVSQKATSMPSIFGIFRVKILISEDALNLTDKELSYIIKHELAHYKRKDNWLNMFITILRCIYIFNPIISFFLLIKVKKDLELATDELAMQKASSEEQKEYLKTLVVLSQRKPDRFLVQTLCLSDEKKNLERRIDSLKLFDKFKKNYKKIMFASILLVIILFITCFTRNSTYMTSNDMADFMESKNNYDTSNYHVKETYKSEDGSIISVYDYYKKDNKVKTVYNYYDDYYEEDVICTCYYDEEERETVITQKTTETTYEYFNYDTINYDLLDNSYKISLLRQITGLKYFAREKYHYNGIEEYNGLECYVYECIIGSSLVISSYDDPKLVQNEYIYKNWIDKNSGLIIREMLYSKEGSSNELVSYDVDYEYEFGTVADEDMQVPDLSGYNEITSSRDTGNIDFYDLRDKILANTNNSERALEVFSSLENLEDIDWRYSYGNEYYKINDEYVFDLKFNSYNNEEYYKLTIRKDDSQILKLEKGKLNEQNELVVTTEEF